MNVPVGRARSDPVSFVIRFVASLAISVWGLTMVLLGLLHGYFLWIAIGVAVTVVGLPLLGSHPWAARRLYPQSGNIEGASPPEPATPPAA
jgi:hypothetical protein